MKAYFTDSGSLIVQATNQTDEARMFAWRLKFAIKQATIAVIHDKGKAVPPDSIVTIGKDGTR